MSISSTLALCCDLATVMLVAGCGQDGRAAPLFSPSGGRLAFASLAGSDDLLLFMPSRLESKASNSSNGSVRDALVDWR
jgi:hypothetical protein